jgi:hypothetical protein
MVDLTNNTGLLPDGLPSNRLIFIEPHPITSEVEFTIDLRCAGALDKGGNGAGNVYDMDMFTVALVVEFHFVPIVAG